MALSRSGVAWIELLNNQREERMHHHGDAQIKNECLDIEREVFDHLLAKFAKGRFCNAAGEEIKAAAGK